MTFFDPRPTRGTGSRAAAPSLYSLAPKTVKPEEDDDGFNLGIGEAFSLFSQGIPALVRTALPGSKSGEMGLADLGKGLVSGVTGTVGGSLLDIGDQLVNTFKPGDDIDLSGAFGRAVGRGLASLPGGSGSYEEQAERFEARDLGSVAEEDGLLPAIIQGVGDLSIVGGLATAPIRGAARAARSASTGLGRAGAPGAAGAASRLSTRLYGRHAALKDNPAVRAIQHPYIEAGRATRSRFLAPAAERAAQAGRILPEDVEVPRPPKRADLETQARDAGLDTEGLNRNQLWEAVDPDGFRAFDDARLKSRQAKGRDPVPPGSAPPVGRLTQAAAGLENRLVARDAGREIRQQTRLADIARRAASRNPAVNATIRTARQHLVQGAGLQPRLAKKIVENEIHARLEGHTLLEAEMPDVPREILRQVRVESGHGAGLLDESLDALPAEARTALDQAIDNAAQLTRAAKDEALQTLRGSRRGAEGLEDLDATDARLTKAQEAKLRQARQLLQRAHGDVQARKIAREAASRKDFIARQQDRLGRIASRARAVAESKLDTLADFDHARTWTPGAWKTAQSLARSAKAIFDNTVANGGATFDPHTGNGRFLVPGRDQGVSVGLVTGTAVKAASTPEIAAATGLPLFSPELVQDVVRAYQDVYEHPNTVIGTWRDKQGIVHIDPGEVLPNLDEALLRAGSRAQEAVYDLGGDSEVAVPLQLRPDVAAQFLDRNSGYLKTAQRVREVAKNSTVSSVDADRHMALLARMAVRARETGLVSHPDEFFGQILKDVEFARRPTKRPGVLRQVFLNRSVATPEARKSLWADVEAAKLALDEAMAWYPDSHRFVEQTFRDLPELTLLNGESINPADLMYQLMAVTSVNAAPRDNLTYALRAIDNQVRYGKKTQARIGKVLKQVTDGKLTLEAALDKLFPDPDKAGRSDTALFNDVAADSHTYGQAKEMVFEILSGQTLDKWTPEHAATRGEKLWGKKDKGFAIPKESGRGNRLVSIEEARRWVEGEFPEFIERYGVDQALKEVYGSALYTKILSFHDNLAHPDTSMGVTLDMWMARLFGVSGFEAPQRWMEIAEGIRETAAELSQAMGRQVMPHEVQAALWVFAKNEISRLRVGHFMTYGKEAMDAVRAGQRLGPELDAYFAEELAPYADDAAKNADGLIERPGRRITRDAESVEDLDMDLGREQVETVFYRQEGKKNKVNEITRRQASWDKKRTEINKLLDRADTAKTEKQALQLRASAQNKLAAWVNQQSRGIKDVEGGSFLDVWDAERYTPSLEEAVGRVRPWLDDPSVLRQQLTDTLLGEFVPSPDEVGGVIRIFENGNFGTLVHESGHLLRRMLTDAEMRTVENVYGVRGRKWSTKAEERFADDLLAWMNGATAPKGLEGSFARVREIMRTVWDYAARTFQGSRVHPDVAAIFSDWLDPADQAMPAPGAAGIVGLPEPSAAAGTLRQQAARRPGFAEPPARAEDFYQSGKKGAEALAKMERLEQRRATLEATRARVQKSIEEVQQVLDEDRLPSQLQKAGLEKDAARLISQVYDQNKNPSLARTPAKWQPMLNAVRQIAKQAEDSPELAAALAELPQTLPEIIRLAESRGFDPTHVRHFTNDQVKRVMFGSMRLGGGRGGMFEEAVSGTRKQRRATLLRSGRVNRSLEALTGAVAEIHNEVRTNAVIDWIENGVARNIEQGAEIPQGWVAWEPIRTGLLTDEVVSEATGRAVRTANRPTQIIPKAVEGTLRKYTKDYGHWFPQMLARVTNPWRALVLTMSPGWYLRNFIGNTILAVNAAGLDVAAWKAAWQDYRKQDEFGAFADLPFVGRGGTATDLDLDGSSLLPVSRMSRDDLLGGLRGVREAAQNRAGQGEILGRTRGALGEIQRKVLRANEVVDEFSRAYVYHHGKLKKGWTENQAIEEANAALVDYGALSNWERQVVRAAIPFYSWQKGILKVVLKQGIDHPGRAAVLMHLGRMNEEYMADRLGLEREDIPNQMMHLIGGRDFRSANPFADAGSLVSPAGIAQSVNPFVDIAVRKALGAPEFFPESHRLSPFGTAEADVNVADELIGLGAGLPGARALGIRRPGQEDVDPVGTRVGRFLGVPREMDDQAMRSRLLRARKIIRGIDNPETGQEKKSFSFDPRGR